MRGPHVGMFVGLAHRQSIIATPRILGTSRDATIRPQQAAWELMPSVVAGQPVQQDYAAQSADRRPRSTSARVMTIAGRTPDTSTSPSTGERVLRSHQQRRLHQTARLPLATDPSPHRDQDQTDEERTEYAQREPNGVATLGQGLARHSRQLYRRAQAVDDRVREADSR
jgi:hypothetical protein